MTAYADQRETATTAAIDSFQEHPDPDPGGLTGSGTDARLDQRSQVMKRS